MARDSWDQRDKQRTITSVAQLLRDRLPPAWQLHVDLDSSGEDQTTPDGVLRIVSPAKDTATYIVEAKRRFTSRSAEAASEQNYRSSPGQRTEVLPLIVAPYLPQRTREALTEQGTSFADATGNLLLIAREPGLWVSAQGATRDPGSTGTSLRSLKGRSAGRSTRALVEVRPPYGVRELAARVGVQSSTLSRVIDLLEREDLVERGDRLAVVSLDWQGALRRWSLDYTLRTSNRLLPCLDPRGTSPFTQELIACDLTYAATAAFGAQRFIPYLPARSATVFVPDAHLARERLGLRASEFGANVMLVEPYDPVVFERTLVRDDLICANPAQIVADLLTGPGREPSTGEELMTWMEANDDAWRH